MTIKDKLNIYKEVAAYCDTAKNIIQPLKKVSLISHVMSSREVHDESQKWGIIKNLSKSKKNVCVYEFDVLNQKHQKSSMCFTLTLKVGAKITNMLSPPVPRGPRARLEEYY